MYPNAEEHGKLHCYPYFTPDGVHIANKIRKTDGTYFIEGPLKEAGLFGQNLFPAGGKAITIVEGECDALAVFEMTGHRYPVVSVRNGADGAAKDCTESFEYLNSFDTIVVCMDTDQPKVNPRTGAVRYPGQEAAQAIANLFAIGKVRVLTLREGKDANEYLQNGKSDKFVKEWFQAPFYSPRASSLERICGMTSSLSASCNQLTIRIRALTSRLMAFVCLNLCSSLPIQVLVRLSS